MLQRIFQDLHAVGCGVVRVHGHWWPLKKPVGWEWGLKERIFEDDRQTSFGGRRFDVIISTAWVIIRTSLHDSWTQTYRQICWLLLAGFIRVTAASSPIYRELFRIPSSVRTCQFDYSIVYIFRQYWTILWYFGRIKDLFRFFFWISRCLVARLGRHFQANLNIIKNRSTSFFMEHALIRSLNSVGIYNVFA